MNKLKMFFLWAVLVIVVLLLLSDTVLAQTKPVSIRYKDKDYVVGHDIVAFRVKEKYYNSELLKKFKELNYEIVFTSEKARSVFLRTDGKSDILEHYYKFEKEEYVEKVFPSEGGSLCSVTPNDTYYSLQYALPKIKIPEAWAITTGDPNVKIAILDSGIPLDANGNLSHPDLQNSNRIILGKDCTASSNGLSDNIGHGTKVAGVVGAETNNGTGIAGVAYNSKIFIYKVSDGDFVHPTNMYGAIVDAIQKGCKIININFALPEDSLYLVDGIINYAQQNNVLVVAAAGNSRGSVSYPARYAGLYNNVIAVSATDSNDVFVYNFPDFSGSNYGTEVTVAAPGLYIYTTFNTGFYNYTWGTSLSSPIVAGVAGLVWSKFPHLTAAQVRKQIELSADDLGTPGRDNYYGHGRVNAYNAVRYLYVPQIYPTIQNALSYATAGQTILVSSGTPDVPTSLTIPSGITLEIKGTTVNFYYGLTVYGNLITNNATLTFGSSTYNTSLVCYGKVRCDSTTFSSVGWQGISLYANGTDSSVFNYCKFVNVVPSSALRFYGSSNSTVSFCELSKGIYASGSTLKVGKNKIRNGSNTGVEANSSSTIYFGLPGTSSSCNSGNNTITGNGGGGIYANYSSNLYLTGSGCTFNNVSGNTTFNGSVSNYSIINSSETYWGSPTLLIIDGTGGTISNLNPISCIPSLPFKIGFIEEDNSNVATPELKKVAFSSVSSDVNELLKKAQELQFNDNYNEALDIYKSILSFTKDTFYVSQSLTGIRFVYGVTKDKGILEYVKEYSKGEKPPYVKIAYANMLVISDNFDEAMLEYEKVAKNNSNTCYEILSLVSQTQLYYFWKHDEKKANEILDYVEKVAPDDSGFKNIRSIVPRGDGNNNKEYFNNEEIEETEVRIAGYSLNNYPNPFNPTTNIQFTIPKDEHVKLTVYDITGRVVKELVNGYKTAGKYSIEFNANNYASGTYYYRLESGEYKNIQKMMLVK